MLVSFEKLSYGLNRVKTYEICQFCVLESILIDI